MGGEKPVRKGRDDSGKRTIVAAARRPTNQVQTPNAPPTAQQRRASAKAPAQPVQRETIVLPMVTLPSIPAMPALPPTARPGGFYPPEDNQPEDDFDPYNYDNQAYEEEEQELDESWDVVAYEPMPSPTGGLLQRYRSNTEARALNLNKSAAKQSQALTKVGSNKAARQYNKQHHPFEVFFVPGRNLTRRLPPKVRSRFNQAFDQLDFVGRNKMLLVVLALVTVLMATLVAISSTTQAFSNLNAEAWQAVGGSHDPPTPTPIPAPDITAPSHYVYKYGFDWPGSPQGIPGDEYQRMAFMLPFAYRATAAYDRRYHNSIEPEMIVWWTHAEGIGARINYSNCANRGTRAGTNYFTDIENCPVSNFWQLGYGNQFSVIYVLKNAFTDLYGDPNNKALVQKVGQWVLNFDSQQGTVPTCGGYPCTFPAMTIDQIMSGIDETSGVLNADNWWASVLSRDPAINCYMIAQALSFFNHAATLNWVGCYYYEPCWGYESNRLGDVLAAWPGLRKAAHI